jgi:hypothetical protein
MLAVRRRFSHAGIHGAYGFFHPGQDHRPPARAAGLGGKIVIQARKNTAQAPFSPAAPHQPRKKAQGEHDRQRSLQHPPDEAHGLQRI